MIRLASPPGLLAAIAGLIVWAIGFSALYGLSALGCEYGWTARGVAGVNVFQLVLGLVWALHLAALAFLVHWSWAQRADNRLDSFLKFVAVILAATGLGAMIWTGFPFLTTSPCM